MELIRRMEDEARAVLPEAVYDYYAGGAGEEQTIADNLAAWRRVWLRARGMVDVAQVGTATELLGHRLALPVVLAPIAKQGLLTAEGERATARAAARAGTVFCLSTSGTCSPAQVAEAGADGPRWFQLYVDRDRAVTTDLLASLAPAGFGCVVVTIDLAVVGRRERELRHAGREAHVPGGWDTGLTWDDLAWVREAAGLPLVVKGVVTAEDARLAADHGAQAVVVSNHGGRQLDGCVPTAVALREVVEELAGAVAVLVDGGIRSGTDVVRALALGADAAMVGRPYAWALAARGEEGVVELLAALAEDVRTTLALVGVSTPADVTSRSARLAGW